MLKLYLEGLGEYLQQVPIVVVIDEDFEFLERINVFLDLYLRALQSFSELAVVRVRNIKELCTAIPGDNYFLCKIMAYSQNYDIDYIRNYESPEIFYALDDII